MSRGRKADVSLRLAEFEIPPMQDILMIGRDAPIGPEAAKRMVDALAPEQYELIRVPEGPIEAIVVRRRVLNMIPSTQLVPLLLEEAHRLSPEAMVIRGKLDIEFVINREVQV